MDRHSLCNSRVEPTQIPSRVWDVEKAVQTVTGFQVLLVGQGRSRRYKVWTTDVAGVVKERSRWMRADQMMSLGYEELFGRDFNADSIIGAPLQSMKMAMV